MDAVLDTARAAGWPAEQLHYEFFAAEVEHRDDDESFEVEVASSGQVVRVTPAQTVVQALESIGVCVQTSCEQGVCGTCLTRVISGQPDHRDMYLTEDEQAANDQFLPCCSRARSAAWCWICDPRIGQALTMRGQGWRSLLKIGVFHESAAFPP
jgi:vanillate O-demethylase ferredoxin subunit